MTSGSSPLARGTLTCCFWAQKYPRLIPARAGNTHRSAELHHLKPAHPRSRGEHAAGTAAKWLKDGSSPLARGTRRLWLYIKLDGRLIPARAGNTMGPPTGEVGFTAHPRSRGEHTPPSTTTFSLFGSSPLARGTLRPHVHCSSPVRLIPARAGNTLADMGFHPLHQQNRITLKPEPASRIHDKQ